jgi:hypothetical protein
LFILPAIGTLTVPYSAAGFQDFVMAEAVAGGYGRTAFDEEADPP